VNFPVTKEQYDTLGTTLFVMVDDDNPALICGSCGVQTNGAPCHNCGVTWTCVTHLYERSDWTDDQYRAACLARAREVIGEATYVQRHTLLPREFWPVPQYRGQMTIMG